MSFIVKSDSTIYCGIEIFCRGFVFLPKSLVELNSILLKITFGSYKFFGFFKRANYNRKLYFWAKFSIHNIWT
jgi:hypothetical protein